MQTPIQRRGRHFAASTDLRPSGRRLSDGRGGLPSEIDRRKSILLAIERRPSGSAICTASVMEQKFGDAPKEVS